MMCKTAFAKLRNIVKRPQSDGLSTVQPIKLTVDQFERLNPCFNTLQEGFAKQAQPKTPRIDRLIHISRDPKVLLHEPIAAKEIILITPAVYLTVLSFLAKYYSKFYAPVVRKLRRAGAVVIGIAKIGTEVFGVRKIVICHSQVPEQFFRASSGGTKTALAVKLCSAALILHGRIFQKSDLEVDKPVWA